MAGKEVTHQEIPEKVLKLNTIWVEAIFFLSALQVNSRFHPEKSHSSSYYISCAPELSFSSKFTTTVLNILE